MNQSECLRDVTLELFGWDFSFWSEQPSGVKVFYSYDTREAFCATNGVLNVALYGV